MAEVENSRDTSRLAASDIPLVIVSGLPASGKSTLSRGLAAALSLALIDKDVILEGLFEIVQVNTSGNIDVGAVGNQVRRLLNEAGRPVLDADS